MCMFACLIHWPVWGEWVYTRSIEALWQSAEKADLPGPRVEHLHAVVLLQSVLGVGVGDDHHRSLVLHTVSGGQVQIHLFMPIPDTDNFTYKGCH